MNTSKRHLKWPLVMIGQYGSRATSPLKVPPVPPSQQSTSLTRLPCKSRCRASSVAPPYLKEVLLQLFILLRQFFIRLATQLGILDALQHCQGWDGGGAMFVCKGARGTRSSNQGVLS